MLVNCVRNTIAAFFIAGSMVMSATAQDPAKPVAGWAERATLFPQGVIVNAKLDTGAEISSINAAGRKFFTRDGKRWVQFPLTSHNSERTVTIERPVVRVVEIKRFFGLHQDRSVIELELCVGSVRKTVEVSLVDRTGLDYQLLVGRNFLGDDLLVSAGSTYRLAPNCTNTGTTGDRIKEERRE